MTRRYPDQHTPAHLHARVASAARAASFKSVFLDCTFGQVLHFGRERIDVPNTLAMAIQCRQLDLAGAIKEREEARMKGYLAVNPTCIWRVSSRRDDALDKQQR
jgi:hypothetical protein